MTRIQNKKKSLRQSASKFLSHPLRGYLPDYAIAYIDRLVKKLDVHFKVVSPRKTKLGDCRYPLGKNSQVIITVNQDLEPIQFLVTSLHELAHAQTFIEFGNKVQPHGTEWKNNFSEMLKYVCTLASIPDIEKNALLALSNKPTATSYGSNELQLLTKNKDALFLKDIANGSVFSFNNRDFRKIKLLRTYVLCYCERTNRKYKIHGLAQINPPSEQD